ncbi:MAG TPA: TetR family transcriptional regulator [Ktedonobacterales bacterium]|nr:TetR family transcriptional regulator [Ktedonobacterales bacterium]
MSTLSDTPSLKERQRQEREGLILRAASELFAERGYHATSLEDIAARVGIAKGTIYLHFDSKDDLVLALLKQGFGMYVKALEDALESAATPREKLRAVIEHFTSTAANQGYLTFAAMMRNPTIFSRMAELREGMSQQWERPRKLLAEAIDEGKAAGEFDPQLPTALIATLLTSLVNPHTYRQMMDERTLSSEEIATSLKRFFFRGIAATPECPPSG